MRNGLLGAFCALILAGIGFFWWQGRAEVERGAPPPLVEASVHRTRPSNPDRSDVTQNADNAATTTNSNRTAHVSPGHHFPMSSR